MIKDIRTLLLDGIDANIKKDKNCIIILDNLQQANSNILESLIPVFDVNTKSLLVQGEEIIKRNISIVDSSMESKNANDFLPDSIKLLNTKKENIVKTQQKKCLEKKKKK